jgi:hypothetical protein
MVRVVRPPDPAAPDVRWFVELVVGGAYRFVCSLIAYLFPPGPAPRFSLVDLDEDFVDRWTKISVVCFSCKNSFFLGCASQYTHGPSSPRAAIQR